jgi:hypothetical protein
MIEAGALNIAAGATGNRALSNAATAISTATSPVGMGAIVALGGNLSLL